MATFPSMDAYRHTTTGGDTFARQTQSQSQPTKQHAIGGMTLAKACAILHITEAESTNAASVRRAYLNLARDMHPDKAPAGIERDRANHAFAELGAAKSFIFPS